MPHDDRPSAAIIPLRPAQAAASTTPETFSFAGQPVRVLTIDGDPWFIAKEVCDVLGYADHKNAIKQHCRGVVKHHLTDALGRSQETSVIPERDLYRLAMRSRLSSAEQFEEWVVGTVLPAIRKTGSYVRGEENFDVTTEAGLAAATMHIMAALQAKADSYKARYELAKPKADAFEVIQEADGAVTVTEAAKALKSSRDKLFGFLEWKGWVTKRKPRQATQRAINSGYMGARASVDRGGRARTSPVVTPKGLAWLADYKARSTAA